MTRSLFAPDKPIQGQKSGAKLPGIRSELDVHWFDDWHPALDEALQVLPEMDNYPHELFRLLVQNRGPMRKRVALLTQRGTPIAVAGLRKAGSSWEHVTQWILPGALFPVREGYLVSALVALGVDLRVAWWRMGTAPPSHPWFREMEATPTYRISCSEDPEQYWRECGNFKNVRNVRNRCRGFTFEVDSPGAAEWIIKSWAETWLGDVSPDSPEIIDRLLVANYLAPGAQSHTFSMLDDGTPIAGVTTIVHGNDLVAGVLHRRPEYNWHGIGTRILDFLFCWAAQSDYETLDLGGGHEYKRRWSPQEGERWQFHVCPTYLFWAKQAVRRIRRALST